MITIKRSPLRFTLDDTGFVQGGTNWTEITTYPAMDEKIRAVKVYRTKNDHVLPLQYSIVTASRYDNSYAWPALIAIRNELRMRFGQTNAIRYGIIPQGETAVAEWRKVGDFPDFRERHVHLGSPEFVVMSRDWVPVIRNKRT